MTSQCMDGPLPEGLSEAWSTFLSGERTISDLFAHPLLFPLQRPREMIEMMRVAGEIEPKVLLDIGSDKGGGLWAWLKYLPTLESVIACEIRGLPYAEQFEKAFPKIKFLWLPHSSFEADTLHEVHNFLLNNVGERPVSIDVAFLDGDKSWFHRDFEAYKPMMRLGAVVIMHDVQDPAPQCAFEMCRHHGASSRVFIDKNDSFSAMNREPQTEHDHWLRIWKGNSCGLGIINL